MFTPALPMQSVSGSSTPLATYVPIRSRLIRTTSGLFAAFSDVTNAWGSKSLSLNVTWTSGYFCLNRSTRAFAITSLVSYETPNALILPDAAIGACDPDPVLASADELGSALPAALGPAALGATPLVDGEPPAVLQAPTISDRATTAACPRRAFAMVSSPAHERRNTVR